MSDSDAVGARHDGFWTAFAAKDASAMAEHVTEEFFNMAPGMPRTVGREAARAFWGELFTVGEVTFTAPASASDIEVSGDLAIDTFHWGMSMTPQDEGDTIEDGGDCIWVWRRGGDGVWRVVSAIWNSDHDASGA